VQDAITKFVWKQTSCQSSSSELSVSKWMNFIYFLSGKYLEWSLSCEKAIL